MMPLARGKYVAFCEGDDMWNDTSKLSRQVHFMERHTDYIACVHNTFFYRCDKYCKKFPMFLYNEDTDMEFDDILKWNAFGYQYSSLLVKTEYFISPPFGYGEYPMAMYLSLNGKIRFLARNMSVYRFRSGKHATRANVFSHKAILAELEGTIAVLGKIRDYIKDENRKVLVDRKISTMLAGIESLRSMTDEEYNKSVKKQEILFDLKLFVRAYFRRIYQRIVYRRLNLNN